MTDVRSATADLLEERPDLEDDLRDLLDVDDGDPWAFDDIPLDSGSFGEIVSADIVEKTDGQYRLRNPDAVRAVLDDGETGYVETDPETGTGIDGSSTTTVDLSEIRARLTDVDRVLVGTLAALLVFVVVMRTAFSWNPVFRGEYLVLLGNDPYFYRFWLEQLVRTDPSLGAMPAPVQSHDILMIATLWGLATLVGGGATAVGQVLTWYPIVAAVLVGVLVYKTAVVAFADRRVGLASVALYATTPIVAYRSALGYGDHHAFDYLLVALTLFGLVCLARDDSDWQTFTRRRLSGALALGIGVAGQVHAWRGGLLLLLPLAVYIVVRVATDTRVERSPIQANAWFLGSLGGATVLAIVPHALFGWAGLYRAVAPALLLGGSLAVVGAGLLARRFDVGGREVLAAELGGGILVAGLAWFGLPPVREAITRGVGYFVQTGQTGIVETYSLFSPEYGVITTPLFYLGFGFVFGMAVLAGVTYYVGYEDRPAWLGLVAYGWTFFAASVIQLRFAGQLGIVLSVFGGMGFVYLLAAVDLISGPQLTDVEGQTGRTQFRGETVETPSLSLPDRRTAAMVFALFLLVGGFGGLQTASGTQDLVIEDATFNASLAIDEHAAATNTTWPGNYVFSDWGVNRAYNYYVNGHSRSYAYAQGNYESFITSTNPGQWYERLSEKPTGYVAVGPPGDGANPPSEVMQTRLWNNWGSATAETSGVSHYRAVYANGERKVYELVRGATLVGEAQPGSEVVVTTEVTIDERTFTYRHQSKANPYGIYSVTVPYSGTYEVSENRVQIAEDGIHNGTRYILHDREGRAHWPFNTGDKQFAYDRVGGFTGMIQGATRVDGMTGRALSFDGTDDQVTIASDAGRGVRLLDPNGSVTISFWMRGSLEPSRSRYPTVLTQHSVGNGTVWGFWARTGGADDFGVRVDDRTGTTVKNFGIDTTNFSQWTHVVAVLDRGAGELRLYRNSELVATTNASKIGPLNPKGHFIMGSRGDRDYAPVKIDEIRIFQRAVSDSRIQSLYNNNTLG